jgi:teichoic acid transport system permease protein
MPFPAIGCQRRIAVVEPESAEVLAERNGLSRLSVTPRTLDYLRDVWSRRYYAWMVPLGDWRAQHLNTLLGNLWHLLNPIFFIAVYYLVFGVLIGTKQGVDHFITYLAIGLFVFRYTQTSVETGATSIVGNEGLIRSIYFPRVLLPISSVVYQALVFLPSLIVIFAIALLDGVGLHFSWLLIAPLVGWQGLFNLGGACYAAPITERFRDFPQILSHFFRALFYVSAVMYSVPSLVQSKFAQKLFNLNPMYAYITVARSCIFGKAPPTACLVSIAAWTSILLVSGFSFFRAAEHTYGRS